ncbi:MAG: hypothetical protein IPN94_23470 [Sphingobacteriales bacterium]|nr:hypothetical protein [Sphingobacteriales bacterium]
MDLIDFEKLFNSSFDIEKLKEEAIEGIRLYISDNEIISEFKDCLPSNVKMEDLVYEYVGVTIFINRTYCEGYPFFRVCYRLNEPVKNKPIFFYDLEFNCFLEVMDDYFNVI